VANRCPKSIQCRREMHRRVDFSGTAFSLPTTMTCRRNPSFALVCTNMPFSYGRHSDQVTGTEKIETFNRPGHRPPIVPFKTGSHQEVSHQRRAVGTVFARALSERCDAVE